jgi:protein-S-isoprenylcysteine O-methyltransferase Ste14
MYIGRFIVLSGFGLYEPSATILPVTLPWLLFAHLFVILYHGQCLRATFGTHYNAYWCHTWAKYPRARESLKFAQQRADSTHVELASFTILANVHW